MTRSRAIRRLAPIGVLVGLVVVGAGVAIAAPPPSVTIEVYANGSAEWTVVTAVDLPSETDRAAFDDMADNTTRKAQLRDETVAVYRAVANGSSQQVDREMSVTGESISVQRDGSTGFITVTFRWDGFARVEGDTIHVGDIFAGGFPLVDNQTLALSGPDGYELRSHNITSSAASVAENGVTWDGPATVRSSIDVRFDEVAQTATATAQSEEQATPTQPSTSTTAAATETTGGSGDGFSVLGAAVAVGAMGIFAWRWL